METGYYLGIVTLMDSMKETLMVRRKMTLLMGRQNYLGIVTMVIVVLGTVS